MRRGVLVVAVLALAGCGDPRTEADVERCLRNAGAQVTAPDARERASALVPDGTRYVALASWRSGAGTARAFLAQDEAAARAAQDELRQRADTVKRDAAWLVVTRATKREEKLAFNCIR